MVPAPHLTCLFAIEQAIERVRHATSTAVFVSASVSVLCVPNQPARASRSCDTCRHPRRAAQARPVSCPHRRRALGTARRWYGSTVETEAVRCLAYGGLVNMIKRWSKLPAGSLLALISSRNQGNGAAAASLACLLCLARAGNLEAFVVATKIHPRLRKLDRFSIDRIRTHPFPFERPRT